MKKKFKDYWCYVKVDVYGAGCMLHVGLNNDIDKWFSNYSLKAHNKVISKSTLKRMREEFLKMIGGSMEDKLGVAGRIELDKFKFYAINIKSIEVRSEIFVSALSHECLHIAIKILNRAGVRESPGSGCEALAYLHGYLFKRFLYELWKRTK